MTSCLKLVSTYIHLHYFESSYSVFKSYHVKLMKHGGKIELSLNANGITPLYLQNI